MKHNLPALPDGFIARNATLADVEIAAQMGIDYAMATTGYSDIEADGLRNIWQSPGFDPERDVYLVFSPQGKIAGYMEVWSNSDTPVHPFVWAITAPEFQNLGIGSHMLAWGENHARRVFELLPPDVRIAPMAGTPSVVKNAKELLTNNGWKHIRSSYTMEIEMDAPPPAPVFPAELTIRTFQPADAHEVYRTVDESFSDHFGHVDQPFETGFERFSHNTMEDPLFDPNLWFIATSGDTFAGVCLCRAKSFDDPQAGYINILGVRRPWRKHGLGLAFLNHAFGQFYRRGYKKVTLGVDAQNLTGALRLYEKAGMHIARQFDQYEKEFRPGRELRVE